MVAWYKILTVVVIINLNNFVVALPNVVIVKNKPMTYNTKENFADIITIVGTKSLLKDDRNSKINDHELRKKHDKIQFNSNEAQQKSKIFKTSNFVTNSNFKGGLITKHNFTLNLPINNYSNSTINFSRPENLDYLNDFHNSITTTQQPPFILKPEIVSAIIYSNDKMSGGSIPSKTIQNKITKTKKKKDNGSTTSTPEQLNNFHEHFIQNLDYYRKVLMLNCTNIAKNVTSNQIILSDDDTIKVKPKPLIETKHKDKDKDKDKEKDKKKCKCKKKHHSGHHHHHHHKGSKESYEHNPSYEHKPEYDYRPSIIEEKPQESHKISGIPTTYSHLHEHQHRIQPVKVVSPSINRVTAPINTIPNKIDYIPNKIDYYDTPEKLPPLGDDYEEVGSMFDTFYRAIENAFTTSNKSDEESVEYESKNYSEDDESHSEYSEAESYESNDYSEEYRKKKKRKRRDLSERKNVLKSKTLAKEALKTRIRVPNLNKINQTSTFMLSKQNGKNKKGNNRSRNSVEYNIIEDIMSFRDSFDSYSIEYYEDLSLENRRTNDSRNSKEYKKIKQKKKTKKRNQRDESPAHFITDGLQSIFSYISTNFPFNFFIFKTTGPEEMSSKEKNYDGASHSIAIETTESEFKRPKRENEKLPWSFPSFLQSNQNESSAEIENFTENIDIEKTTAKAMPYDFFKMISQLMTTSKKTQSKSLTTRRIRKKNYRNYQLWRLYPVSRDDVTLLNDFRMSMNGRKIHWLKTPKIKDSIDVIVPPDYVENFEELLTDGEIKYDVKTRNIQHAIEFENPRLNKRDQIELEVINGHPLTWYRYHNFRDIHMYYDYLKRKFPEYIELIQIGWSFNGKPLNIVKVSYPKQSLYDMNKPAIFILSGTAPHLWLPVASSLYILNNLVSNIDNNGSYGKMIRKFNWYVLSLLNPDGYDYSMSIDRLWQKTRSHQFLSNNNVISSALNWFRSSNNNQTENICYGVDMTRNFDSNWNEERRRKGSECTDKYRGSHASSEPEIKLLSNFLLKNNKIIKLFINLDGYGQQIVFPNTKMKKDNIDELNDMARAGLRNLKMHRSSDKKYEINSKNLDISSGTAESYAMFKAKIKHTYRIQSMDNGQYSIFVPATSIEKNANEMLDIMKGMIKHLENE